MAAFVDRIVDIYTEEGLIVLCEKILGNILYYPAFFLFVFCNYYFETRSDTVLLRLRRSMIDADRLTLIESFADDATVSKIYLAVWSKSRYKTNSETYREVIEKGDIEVVRVYGFTFTIAMSTASIINFCHEDDFKLHRLVDRDHTKTYIRTYHGITVKGRYPAESLVDSSVIPRPRVDLRPVSSEIELYSRSALEKRDLRKFDKIGYPRYDRIFDLKKGRVDPALPTASREVVEENSSYDILYAPTHKTGRKIHTFPEFDLETLETALLENDIELYVRMHTNEEGQAVDELLDLENVRYAGHSFSGSSIEILPYMDALITDYSSIFLEFLPFDRPTLFIKDPQFETNYGVRYDYDRYFPGEKIRSFNQFLEHVVQCSKQGDSYEEDREFVRKVFNINSSTDTVSEIKKTRENARSR